MSMLRKIHGNKATMLNGDAFADKINKLMKNIRDEDISEFKQVLSEQTLKNLKNNDNLMDFKDKLSHSLKDETIKKK